MSRNAHHPRKFKSNTDGPIVRGDGRRWPNSPIFGHDMMGSAVGNPENDYQITDGWFANITSILDVDGNLVDPKVNPGHNMYNYIAAEYDYTVSAFVLIVVHGTAPSNHQVVDPGESGFEMMPDEDEIRHRTTPVTFPYLSGQLPLGVSENSLFHGGNFIGGIGYQQCLRQGY